MSVSIEIDEILQRAIAVIPPGTRWSSFETAALVEVNRTPRLTEWNWIIDDQGPMDDVDVAGMMRIGEAFRRLTRDPQRQNHTVVVTTDRFFDSWARVIDLNFGSRKHHSAPTLVAAIALLDRLDAVCPGQPAVASSSCGRVRFPPSPTFLKSPIKSGEDTASQPARYVAMLYGAG